MITSALGERSCAVSEMGGQGTCACWNRHVSLLRERSLFSVEMCYCGDESLSLKFPPQLSVTRAGFVMYLLSLCGMGFVVCTWQRAACSC